MRLIAVLALASVATLSAVAQSGKTWDRTYNIGGRANLSVATGESSIHVSVCGECKAVRIHVDMHEQDLKDYVLEESGSGDRVQFALKRRNESGWGWSKGRSPEVTVQTPSASDVMLQSGSGATELSGINGAVSVTAGSGGVQIADTTGRLQSRTGSGGLMAEGSFTQFQVRSGSSAVRLRLRPGQGLQADSSVTAGSGSVHLEVPRDLRVSVDANSGSGGIHSDIPLMVQGDMGNRRSIRGTLNGGGPQIRLVTGSGHANITSL